MNSTELDESSVQDAKFIQSLADTDGTLECPIDLDISNMKVIELDSLKWIGIDVAPRKLKITNTGYTVIISAKWQHDRPYLTGGPFTENYVFSQIHLHWGENEMIGSEHTVDSARFNVYIKSFRYQVFLPL